MRAEDVAIPVETVAGDVAQVDFGYIGHLYDATVGRLRKAWVFVLVLAHSRWMFARIAFDQKIETWLRCHVEAFTALGGVPRTVVPDNLKAAVVRAAFDVDDPASLNRSYRWRRARTARQSRRPQLIAAQAAIALSPSHKPPSRSSASPGAIAPRAEPPNRNSWCRARTGAPSRGSAPPMPPRSRSLQPPRYAPDRAALCRRIESLGFAVEIRLSTAEVSV